MAISGYTYDTPIGYDSDITYDYAEIFEVGGGARLQSNTGVAEYRYYLVDLLTNVTIAEIPFTEVSYERALSKAGAFSGRIPAIAATVGLDLYESTMPGKTCVFVLRNGVCVWGGIIWGRQYSPSSKTLTVDASEFVSYFHHRAVWQTLFYGTPAIPCTGYVANAGVATVYLQEAAGFTVGEDVKILNLNTALNGTHEITAVADTSFTFLTDAILELSPSNTGIARIVLDSYETTRQIVGQLLTDFSEQGFANDIERPAGFSEISIINKQSASNGDGTSNYTITTDGVHDLFGGQEVEIVDVDSNVDGFRSVVSVPTSTTFVVTVSGTHVVSSTPLTGMTTFDVTSRSIEATDLSISYKNITSNLATITTSTAHGLVPGDTVSVAGLDPSYTYIKSSSGTSGEFTISVGDSSDLKLGMLVSGYDPAIPVGTVVRSIAGGVLTIDKALLDDIPLHTQVSYTQDSVINGTYEVLDTPTTTAFSYVVAAPNLSTISVSSGKASYKSAVLTTSVPHGLSTGDSLVVDGIGVDYDGDHSASYASGSTIRYNVYATLNQSVEGVWGGTIKAGARVSISTYGSYSANSDFGMDVDPAITTKVIGYDQQIFRGSDLRMFGEILEEFSKDLNGFEYRVDCDFIDGSFIKTFTFVPFFDPPSKISVTNMSLTSNIATLTTESAHKLSVGDDIVIDAVGLPFNGTKRVISTPTTTTFTFSTYGYNNVSSIACSGYIGLVHPVSYLGADRVVFEYPGNITDFSVTENAETSSTRMWVVGNTNGLGGDASQPYAAASDTSLLAAGWPILDQVENKSDNITAALGKDALYDYALDYLNESRPPEGNFSITVNGSLDPQVGDYLPGDWCSIILDDDFVRARLANDLEPRDDVIVRKIAGIKVSVPDGAAFPEKVDLELIPEWREDRRNAQ